MSCKAAEGMHSRSARVRPNEQVVKFRAANFRRRRFLANVPKVAYRAALMALCGTDTTSPSFSHATDWHTPPDCNLRQHPRELPLLYAHSWNASGEAERQPG